MRLYYLEIVTPNVDAMCEVYGVAHQTQFGASDPLLGGARTSKLSDGIIVGIRPPLRDTETPVTRPYWLVEDIEMAITMMKDKGAEIAVPPMEIPGKGMFALYIHGGIEQGFWQL